MAARQLSGTVGEADPIADALDEAARLSAAIRGDDDPFGDAPLGDVDSDIAIPEPEAMDVLLGAIESETQESSSEDEPGLDVRGLLARVEEIARKTRFGTEIDDPPTSGAFEAAAPESGKDEQVA